MWVFQRMYKVDKLTNETRESYEVGFYIPNGLWVSEYEFTEKVVAAQQVHFLNGGSE